jgi:hypothetical protein
MNKRILKMKTEVKIRVACFTTLFRIGRYFNSQAVLSALSRYGPTLQGVDIRAINSIFINVG